MIPAVVANPPPPPHTNRGGGDVFGGSGGSRVSLSERRDSLVAQASEQHIVCNTDPGKVPAISSVPPGDTLVNKPMMHSAQKIDLEGIPMEEVVVLEPLAFSVPDLLQPFREVSIPTPEDDISDRSLAVITITTPAYVLFPFTDPFDIDVFSTPSFPTYRPHRGFLQLINRVRYRGHP